MKYRLFLFALLLTWALPGRAEPHSCAQSYGAFDSKVEDLRAKLFALDDEMEIADRVKTNAELEKELLSIARKFLREQKIAFAPIQDQKHEGLRILPSPDSPMGQLALRINKSYGADLVFVPGPTMGQGFAGAAGFRRSNGKNVPALFLGPSVLATTQRPLRHYVVLHELRHLRYHYLHRQDIGDLYDGWIRAVKGIIPHSTGLHLDLYSDLLYFDELRTYQNTTFVQALMARKALRTGNPNLPGIVKGLEKRAEEFRVNANRIHTAWKAAQAAVKEKPEAITLYTNSYGLEGRLTVKVEENELRIRVGLTTAEYNEAGSGRELITKKIDAMLAVADQYEAKSTEVLSLAQELSRATDPAEQDRLLRAIQKALSLVKD